MNFNDITGLASVVILAIAWAASSVPIERLPSYGRWLLCVVTGLLMVIPFADFSAAVYVRGVVGDLSITTLVLLSLAIVQRVIGLLTRSALQIKAVYGLVVPVGLVFYPMVLGLGSYDPYVLGFGATGFLACVFALAIIAWLRAYTLISFCLALAVGAYAVDWYASNNLWDYLIDPLLVIYASFAGIRLLVWGRRIEAVDSVNHS